MVLTQFARQLSDNSKALIRRGLSRNGHMSLLEQESVKSDSEAEAEATLSSVVDQTLNNPSYSPLANALALIMLTFIIISTVTEVLTTVPSFKDAVWMDSVEVTVVVVFTVEYVSRLVVHQGTSRWDFVLSPLNLVDLLAILPFYVELLLGSATQLVGLLRLLRVLRVVRVFRVFKAASMMCSVQTLAKTMRQSQDALQILLFFLALGILLFSSLMYYAEGGIEAADGKFYRSDGSESPFTSIPETFWWAIVTMTTVGYGDTFPVEPMGKVVASLAMVCGIVVLALPISVIGNNFAEVYVASLKDRARYKLEQARVAAARLSGVVDSDAEALAQAGEEMARHAAELQRLTDQVGALLRSGKGPAARAVQLQFDHQRSAMKTAVDNLLCVATNADVHAVALGHDARDPTIR